MSFSADNTSLPPILATPRILNFPAIFAVQGASFRVCPIAAHVAADALLTSIRYSSTTAFAGVTFTSRFALSSCFRVRIVDEDGGLLLDEEPLLGF
jgi:hypothetical protein